MPTAFNASKLFPKDAEVVELSFEPGQSLRARIQGVRAAQDDRTTQVSDVVFAGVERIEMRFKIGEANPRIESAVYRLQDATHAQCSRGSDLPVGLSVHTNSGSVTVFCRSIERVVLQESKIDSAPPVAKPG